jgi:FixJ family two-component response regulator
MMPADTPMVYVIDDDSAARTAVRSLLDSVGLRVETFGSARDFLEYPRPDAPACMVLDVRLPGVSGLDFQRDLAARNIAIPIIFITGHGDIPMSVEAMKAGAVEFLTKPFRGQVLLDAIQKAIERDRAVRAQESQIIELRARAASLTPREHEVMQFVISGLLNKQIAAALGTSERTIKIHRGQAMRKMGADSLPDLVRMAERLGIPSRKY